MAYLLWDAVMTFSAHLQHSALVSQLNAFQWESANAHFRSFWKSFPPKTRVIHQLSAGINVFNLITNALLPFNWLSTVFMTYAGLHLLMMAFFYSQWRFNLCYLSDPNQMAVRKSLLRQRLMEDVDKHPSLKEVYQEIAQQIEGADGVWVEYVLLTLTNYRRTVLPTMVDVEHCNEVLGAHCEVVSSPSVASHAPTNQLKL